jgi:hypothetical protein
MPFGMERMPHPQYPGIADPRHAANVRQRNPLAQEADAECGLDRLVGDRQAQTAEQ